MLFRCANSLIGRIQLLQQMRKEEEMQMYYVHNERNGLNRLSSAQEEDTGFVEKDEQEPKFHTKNSLPTFT